MQRSVKRKKMLMKEWNTSESQADKERYKEAKTEAKKTVAEAQKSDK